MKYIIFKMGDFELPFIFSELIQHDAVVAVIGNIPVSAGFVKINGDKARCFGKSISLKLWSRPEEDSAIINREFESGI